MGDIKWELGEYKKVSLGDGEAPHYYAYIREAGAMPMKPVVRLDFGYASDLRDVALGIVATHNAHEALVSVLDQLLAEVVSDNQALACVDLRIIDRAKAVLAEAAALKENIKKP